MTTFESALSLGAKRLQSMADRRARRREMAHAAAGRLSAALAALWNLLLVLAGLGAFTVAAWTVAPALGLTVAGFAMFALRSLIVWGGDDAGT